MPTSTTPSSPKSPKTPSKVLSSIKWKELRGEILKRDHYKCFICGSEEGLVVHHILYRRGFPELSYEENNLITVYRLNHSFIMWEKLRKNRKNQHLWLQNKLKKLVTQKDDKKVQKKTAKC